MLAVVVNKRSDGLIAREEQENYRRSSEISINSVAGAVARGQRTLPSSEGPGDCTLLLCSRRCGSHGNYDVRIQN